MFTIGQACIYIPNGTDCRVLRVYPDRHRARIKVSDSGQEIDEVAWHDLAPKEGVVLQTLPKEEVQPPEPVVVQSPPPAVAEPETSRPQGFRPRRSGRVAAGDEEEDDSR